MRSYSPLVLRPPAQQLFAAIGATGHSRFSLENRCTSILQSQDLPAAPSLLGNSEFLSSHSVYLAFALHVSSFIYSLFDIPGLIAESREAPPFT